MRAIGRRDVLAFDNAPARARHLLLAPSIVIGLAAGPALAQSSAVLSVTARIIAACTVTSSNPESTCSDEILSLQGDVANASARISTTDTETVITHQGGAPPEIETRENRISVSF